MMGQHPTGYAAFLPDGHIFFILTAEARKPAKTDKERTDLLSTVVAYTGTYTVEGATWTAHVEVAWNPEWVGTAQVRSFTLNGDDLQVLTPWRVIPRGRTGTDWQCVGEIVFWLHEPQYVDLDSYFIYNI
jgi:Lipocalin-like domain